MTQVPHHHPALAPLIRLLVWAGKRFSCFLSLHNSSGLFCFFPFYHTGGAEKVHADIVTCFATERPWVFFTKRSSDLRFRKQFTDSARCFDIGWLLKYTYPFSVGILAGLIGKYPHARVFGCNSLYYYLLLPHLPEHVRATDLLHALGGGAEQFALPVLERLQQRVVISAAVRDELIAWYREQGVDGTFDECLTVIANRVELPAALRQVPADGPIRLLYVGRSSAEKRVHLIGRLARQCRQQGLAVSITLVGDLQGVLTAEQQACCTLTGLISDAGELSRQYQQADLLLITSSREGFPLVVMEGMAHGCVPVCTRVGGIPEHIRHLKNGWLMPADDEQAVLDSLLQAVTTLAADRSLLQRLSLSAHAYAKQEFGGERFCEEYRRVILG